MDIYIYGQKFIVIIIYSHELFLYKIIRLCLDKNQLQRRHEMRDMQKSFT